jgi:transposase
MAHSRQSDSKLTALEESGTANPRPQSVRDPTFAGSEFFDPRDLVQVRYEMLRRVLTEGEPVAETARRFGVSRPTFYKTQESFTRAGLTGLLPGRRGPRGPHKITAEVLRFIQARRAQDESLNARSLAEEVLKQFGVPVHPRTVERALARWKKKRP